MSSLNRSDENADNRFFSCSFFVSEIGPPDIGISLSSETFQTAGIKFRIRLRPWNGNGNLKEVAVFIDLDEWSDMSPLLIQFTISIINKKDEMLSILMDDTKLISTFSDRFDLGFLHFMTSIFFSIPPRVTARGAKFSFQRKSPLTASRHQP